MKCMPPAFGIRCSAGRRPARAGAVATELAFILPVLIFIMLAIVDFGRFAATYVAVTNAARAGGGYAITHPVNTASSSAMAAWTAQVQQTARDEMAGQAGCNPTLLAVTTVIVFQNNSRRIQVTARYDSFQTMVPWPGISSKVVLTRAVVMPAIR